jgi:hypothetical protein
MNLNDGLIGAWVPVLGNTGQVLLDRSASRAHCDIGTMTWTSRDSYAHVLQGTGSHTVATVTTTGSLKRKYPFAFSSWFRITGLGANRTLFNTCRRPGNYAGFGAAVNTGGALVLGYGDNGGTNSTGNQRFFTSPTSVVTTNQWYHLAGVFYDHLVADAWVNGVLQTTTLTGNGDAVVQNTNDVTIAGGTFVGSAALLGQFAELRLWNRILLGSEVSELYYGGAGYGLTEPERRVWRIAFAPTTGTTGAGASTLGAATSTASGTQTFVGTAAATLGDVIASASGDHIGSVSGSAAATLGDVIASASGDHIGSVSGSAAVQSAATTASASGAVSVTGSCGSTSGETTGSGSGICQTNGSVSVALAASGAVAVGTVGAGTVTGAAAVALSDTSATALASVTVVGMCAATTPPVTSSAYALDTTADVLLVGHTGTATLTGAVGTANLKGRKIWA